MNIQVAPVYGNGACQEGIDDFFGDVVSVDLRALEGNTKAVVSLHQHCFLKDVEAVSAGAVELRNHNPTPVGKHIAEFDAICSLVQVEETAKVRPTSPQGRRTRRPKHRLRIRGSQIKGHGRNRHVYALVCTADFAPVLVASPLDVHAPGGRLGGSSSPMVHLVVVSCDSPALGRPAGRIICDT